MSNSEPKNRGFISELFTFFMREKKWWLLPLLVLIVLIALLAVLGSHPALAPFIYPFL
jgi:hypothetical protein